MKVISLFSVVGAITVALASATGAQPAPSGPPAGASNMGGPRPQDIAAANRQVDDDYNTLAARGVKVTNQDRANMSKPTKPGTVVRATAADIKAGMPVRDIKGIPVGTIAVLASNEVADPSVAVIDTGQTKIGVPLSAFGKDDKGLLLSITAEKFNEAVARAHASAQAQPAKSN